MMRSRRTAIIRLLMLLLLCCCLFPHQVNAIRRLSSSEDSSEKEEKKAKVIKAPKEEGGNLPRAFNQVWNDATKVSKSHLRTNCLKPHKVVKREKRELEEDGEDDKKQRRTATTTIRTITHSHDHIHWVDGVNHYHHSHPHTHSFILGEDGQHYDDGSPQHHQDDGPHYTISSDDPMDQDECGGDYYDPVMPGYEQPGDYHPTPSEGGHPPSPPYGGDHWVPSDQYYPMPSGGDHYYQPMPSGGDHYYQPMPSGGDNYYPPPTPPYDYNGPPVPPYDPPVPPYDPPVPPPSDPRVPAPTPFPVEDPVNRPVPMPSPIADDPVDRPVPMPSPIADDGITRPSSNAVETMPSPIPNDGITRPSSNVVETPTANNGIPSPNTVDPPAPTTVATPTMTTDPVPTSETLSLETICAEYRAGTAPTSGNIEEHSIFVTLNVESTVEEQVVLDDLLRALQTIVGPSVLGCPNRRILLMLKEEEQQQRHLQATQMTNIVFDPPTRNTDTTCTQAVADSKCIPVQVDASVYYVGEQPPNAGGKLRQALFLLPAGSITGFQGWGEIAVVPPGQGPGTTVATDRGNGGGGGDIEENKGVEPGRSPNAIAFVAAAAASLVVILAALFLIRRRRKDSVHVTKNRELTDDEDDRGFETNDESYDAGSLTDRAAPKAAYVLNDDLSMQDSTNGRSIYKSVHHGPYETCSSPSCAVCEAKRQQGTRFIVTEDAFRERNRRSTSSSSSRRYAADDTVQL